MSPDIETTATTETKRESRTSASTSKLKKKLSLRVGIVILVFIVAALIAWRMGYFHLGSRASIAHAIRKARGNKFIIPLYVLVYATVATLALPVSPLQLAAGALFGFWLGAAYAWIGAMIGAVGGYWLARLAGQGIGKKLLARAPDISKRLKGKRGALSVFQLQIMPITPFGLVNAACGIAGVPIVSFLVGTAFGAIPGVVAYVFAGERLWSGLAAEGKSAILWTAVGLAVLLLLSFLPMIIKKFRKPDADDEQPEGGVA